MKRHDLSTILVVALALGCARPVLAQSVTVTASLDSPSVSVGQTNRLHVYAQVVPNLRTNSDRIFSWYVDVLNTNGAAATAQYGSMQKSASDNDPQTSSNGVSQGSNRRGIYDTFLNLPGAGVSNAVELMSIPVTGLAPGQTRFLVQAGSGVSSLSSDFTVAPKSGPPPYTGGDYTLAFVDMTVVGSAACNIQLLAARQPGGTLLLSFTPCAGRNNNVEFRAALNDVTGWQSLPGAPHNSGSVIVTNTTDKRFFRVRASTP